MWTDFPQNKGLGKGRIDNVEGFDWVLRLKWDGYSYRGAEVLFEYSSDSRSWIGCILSSSNLTYFLLPVPALSVL